MSEEDPTHFASKDEEIAYWKNATQALRVQLANIDMDFEEFRTESGEFEQEQDKEISRLETISRELRMKNEKYKMDIEELKEKYQNAQLKAGEDLASIERELQFVRSQQEYYKSRTRELEQDNDDLERNERMAKSSLQDYEVRYSQLREENSHLLNEVAAKKVLEDESQRLKDELKDLKLELHVLNGRNSRAVPQVSGLSKSSANIDSSASRDSTRMTNEIMARVRYLEATLSSARTKVSPLIGAAGRYATVHSRGSIPRTIAKPRQPSSFAASTDNIHTNSRLQRSSTLRPHSNTESQIAPPSSSISNGSTVSVSDQRLARTRQMRMQYQQRMSRTAELHAVPQQTN